MQLKDFFTEKETAVVYNFKNDESHILRLIIANRILIQELKAEVKELKELIKELNDEMDKQWLKEKAKKAIIELIKKELEEQEEDR